MSRRIPLEIELEIIQRLPVKSLIRFISACKAWKSLIKCSEFVAGYRVRPAQPHHLLVTYAVGVVQEPDYEVKFVHFVDDDIFPRQKFAPTIPPILELLGQSRIIGSSCGLLCFDGLLEQEKSTMYTAVLWNPSIGKSIVVAVPNVVDQRFKYVIGFGVCPYTNDPKLVKVTYISNPWEIETISCIPCQIMVFKLSSREWTPSCSNQLPRKSIEFTEFHTVIGQFIYWAAYDDESGNYLIMSFDMSTEEFREIDLPDSLADDVYDSNMSVSRLRESLVVLVHDYVDLYGTSLPWKRFFDVWMMEHGAFTKIFTINAPNASVSWILGFRKSGEPVVEMEYDNKDIGTLAVYEPCSKHITDLGLGIRGNRSSFYGSSYTESLLLLDRS